MDNRVLLFRPPLANPAALQMADRADLDHDPLVGHYRRDLSPRKLMAQEYGRVRNQLEDILDASRESFYLKEVPLRQREKHGLYQHDLDPHHEAIQSANILTLPFPTYFQVRFLCSYVLENNKRLVLLAPRQDLDDIGYDIHDYQTQYASRTVGPKQQPRNIFLANIHDEDAVAKTTLKAISL